MATDRPERTRQRRKRLLRMAGAILVGATIGYLCPEFPPSWQPTCHLAAKIVGFLLGSG